MMQRMELQPGVWLNFVQTDRFKTGCFSVNFLRPLTMPDAAPNALLPSVLLRGCGRYPDMTAISARLDTLYGASAGTLVRKKGEVQTVGLYADFLEDRFAGEPLFAQLMDFLGDILFDPCMENDGFVEHYVAGEKQNLSNAIAATINDKRAYAVAQLLKHMFPGETYAVPRIGESHTLDGVNGKNLYARYRELLQNAPLELFYLGRQSVDTVAKTVGELFSALPQGGRKLICPSSPMHTGSVRYVEESLDVTQGKLTMGLRTDITAQDSRYPALMLLNAVFGSGMNSKLFLQIREARSLCYYASSSIDKHKGVMLVDSGISFEKYQEAHDGILEQLNLCKNGAITDQELESARTFLISALRSALDNPGRMDDYAVGQACIGLSDGMEELITALERVTMEQTVEAANTLTLDTVYFLKGVER